MPRIDSYTDETAALALDDEYILWTGSAVNNVTTEIMRQDIRDNERWLPLTLGTDYNEAPFSTSRIHAGDSGSLSLFYVGQPLRYTYGGTAYYGIATAVNQGPPLSIDIAGAPLVVGTDLTELAIGRPEMVAVKRFFVSGAYDTGGTQAEYMANKTAPEYHIWRSAPAYMVQAAAVQDGVAVTTQPTVNPTIASTPVFTSTISLGTQGTQVLSSAVAVDTAAYDIAYGQTYDFDLVVGNASGEADDLTLTMVFVYG